MSFGTSQTYIYAYIGFASVYLIASFAFVANALRVSVGLSRSRQAIPAEGANPAPVVSEVLDQGQRIIDSAQLATLLPLVYIVGSMFLGSVIVRDTGLARTVNVGWIAFTVACAVASVWLSVSGVRAAGAIGRAEFDGAHAPEAVQRIGVRLGVSAALLLLVAVFMLLNLWSVAGSLDALSTVDFLL